MITFREALRKHGAEATRAYCTRVIKGAVASSGLDPSNAEDFIQIAYLRLTARSETGEEKRYDLPGPSNVHALWIRVARSQFISYLKKPLHKLTGRFDDTLHDIQSFDGDTSHAERAQGGLNRLLQELSDDALLISERARRLLEEVRNGNVSLVRVTRKKKYAFAVAAVASLLQVDSAAASRVIHHLRKLAKGLSSAGFNAFLFASDPIEIEPASNDAHIYKLASNDHE